MVSREELNRSETIRWVAETPRREHMDAAGVKQTRSTVLAVVGLSKDPDRPSYRVSAALQRLGYRIVPVNPTVQNVLGETAYPDLASIPEPVDVIQVFRRAEHTPEIAQAAATESKRLGTRVFWLQEGIINDQAVAIAQAAGMQTVMDRCLYKEVIRLTRSAPN